MRNGKPVPRPVRARTSTEPSPRGTPVPNDDPEALFRNSIGYHVRKTYRMTENFIQEKLAAHDIQVGMWYFLRTLWVEEGLTQRELSRRVGATEPTTLEQLRKMEKRGLVERRRDKIDRRKTGVFLTRRGRSLKDHLLPFVEDLNDAAFKGFGAQEIQQLETLLHRVRENLHAVQKL